MLEEGQLIPIEDHLEDLKYRISSALAWLPSDHAFTDVVKNNLLQALKIIDILENQMEE